MNLRRTVLAPESTELSVSVKQGTYFWGGAYVLASIALSLHFLYGRPANLVLIGIMLLLIARKFYSSQTKLLATDWSYLLYFSFALLSATWSVSPSASVEQALPMIVPWLITFMLWELNEAWACKLVVWCAVIGSLLSVSMVAVSRQLAYQPVSSTGAPELRGIFAHQLFLGAFIVISLALLALACLNGDRIYVIGKSKFALVAIVLVLCGVLFLSRTRIYIGVGILAFALTWLFSRTQSRRWVAVNLLGTFVIAGYLGYGRLIEYLEERNFDLTLTGRTYIWDRTLSALSGQSDILGFGFGTFQLPVFDYLFTRFRPTHAHNAFIQAYFELGAVGLTILLILVVAQLRAAWQYSVSSGRYSYSLFLVLFSIFGSLTGSAIYAGFLTTPFCLMMLFLAIESRKLKNPVSGRLSRAAQGPVMRLN